MDNKLFLIPEPNQYRFLFEISKMNKRAAKLGCAPFTATLVDTTTATHKRETGLSDWTYRVFHYAVDAVAPHLSGWTFVATIDHTMEAGNVIRKIDSAVEIPTRYRHVKSICEHCNTSRQRNDTFLLRNAAGEFKQVGRTCLQDFFASNMGNIAKYADLIANLNESGEALEEFDFASGRNHIYIPNYLANVAAIIRKYGWMGRMKAREMGDESSSTADCALSNMLVPSASDHVKVTDEDYAMADAAIEWGQSLKDKTTPLSDYEHSVLVVAGSTVCNLKLIGIAASIVYVHQLNVAREADRAAAEKAGTASVHVGKEGERLRNVTVTLTHKLSISTSYGPMTIFLFSYNGNVLKWFTGPKDEVSFKPGDDLLLSATVFKHADFKGRKQTEVKRCILKPLEK